MMLDRLMNVINWSYDLLIDWFYDNWLFLWCLIDFMMIIWFYYDWSIDWCYWMILIDYRVSGYGYVKGGGGRFRDNSTRDNFAITEVISILKIYYNYIMIDFCKKKYHNLPADNFLLSHFLVISLAFSFLFNFGIISSFVTKLTL